MKFSMNFRNTIEWTPLMGQKKDVITYQVIYLLVLAHDIQEKQQ